MNESALVLDGDSQVTYPVTDQIIATATGNDVALDSKAARLSMRPVPTNPLPPLRSRRITPQAGRALEILGHATDYLIDEWVYAKGESLSPTDPHAEAIYLLMQLNREIYDSCPPMFTFLERFESAFLGLFGLKTIVKNSHPPKEANSSPIYPHHR